MCETRHSIVFWVYFKTQTLLETLKILNLSRGEFGVSSEVERVFLQVGCARNKFQSHTSTESEVISLDAGLRLDGIPALDLWDLIVTVLHGNTNQSDQVQGDLSTSLTRKEKSWKDW